MGAASFLSIIVPVGVVASLALDKCGWVGFEVHPNNLRRVLGAVIITVGVVIVALSLGIRWHGLRQVHQCRNDAAQDGFAFRGTGPRSIVPLHPSTPRLRFLVAESEPPDAREKRRESVGRSSGESYVETLERLAPGAICHRITPADADCALQSGESLAGYDAIFLSGSPLSLYEDTPEVRRSLAFMGALFGSGTPSFGSCAGLQVATVAAGGTVGRNRNGPEAGFARRIVPTEAGRSHPLLKGRPAAYDAPSIHTDEVETLPDGATLLALNRSTVVQAAEIRQNSGTFWGVQYHPEIGLDEVTGALRRQADDLVESGLARTRREVEEQADLVEALHCEPDRRDLAWRLGLDDQVTDDGKRRIELTNFIEALVIPVRNGRR
nr:gamma-glutamyl-gamma-aminobutyrate hydrolase family protein [Methylobacterium sp. Leaf87]